MQALASQIVNSFVQTKLVDVNRVKRPADMTWLLQVELGKKLKQVFNRLTSFCYVLQCDIFCSVKIRRKSPCYASPPSRAIFQKYF